MKKIVIAVNIFMISFMLCGCAFHLYGEIPDYERKEYIVENISDKIDIIIYDEDVPISVIRSTDNDVHLEYYDAVDKSEYYEIAENKDALIVNKKAEKNDGFYLFGDRVSSDSYKDVKLVLAIPDERITNLEIESLDSEVMIDAVKINRLILKSHDGDIELSKVSISESIACITEDGDVTGSLAGKETDFDVKARSNGGDSNIRDRQNDGSKTLEISTDDGDIDIIFVDH